MYSVSQEYPDSHSSMQVRKLLAHSVVCIKHTSNYFRDVEALSTTNFSRNCNLHGKHIKALTIEEIPYMHFTSENYKNIDHLYHSSSETYDVTNFTSGFLKDFIKIMSFACNFTYEIHVRKDGKQGGVTESNGTLIATGVFDDLINGKGIHRKCYHGT